MVAKKASSKKRASVTKTTAKKTAAVTAIAKASIVGNKVQLDFPLDASKVAAIQRCIAKGTLRVTVNKVDLGADRLRGPWLYD